MQEQWLAYFLALAENANVSETARQFGISDSSLNRKIKSLEQELGVPLFKRFSRPLSLTPQGLVLLKNVPVLLRTLNQLEDLQLQRRSLQLGWFDAWGVFVMPALLRTFQQSSLAQISIESHFLNPADALELLDKGLLDLWLSTWRVNQSEYLSRHELQQRGLGLLTGPCSDFVIVGRPRPATDWQSLSYVNLRPHTFSGALWDDGHYPRRIVASLTSVSDVVELCRHSSYAAYLPRQLIQSFLQRKQLAVIAEAPQNHSIEPGIVFHHQLPGDWQSALFTSLSAHGFRSRW